MNFADKGHSPASPFEGIKLETPWGIVMLPAIIRTAIAGGLSPALAAQAWTQLFPSSPPGPVALIVAIVIADISEVALRKMAHQIVHDELVSPRSRATLN